MFSLSPAIKPGSSLSSLESDTRRVKWKRNNSPWRVTGGPAFWTWSPHTHHTLFCYHPILCQLHSDQPECLASHSDISLYRLQKHHKHLDSLISYREKNTSRGKARVEGCYICLLELTLTCSTNLKYFIFDISGVPVPILGSISDTIPIFVQVLIQNVLILGMLSMPELVLVYYY